MARIRTVKPEFWIDERVGNCSPTARLLFIATWNFADDNGNLERSSRQLKAQVFPYDSLEVEPLLLELISCGLLEEYEVSGNKYLHISNFEKHQKIEKKSAARFPLPDYSPTTPRPVGIGREGKVKEEEGNIPADSDLRVLEIVQAYPFSKYRHELEIPPSISSAILKAYHLEGNDFGPVLEYTRGYARSVDNPKYVMAMEKFFSDPNIYRRDWNAKPVGKFTQLLATVSEPYCEPGEQFGATGDR